MNRILNYKFLNNEELTIRKLCTFSIVYIPFTPLSLGAMYLLTDILGFHYLFSTILVGAAALFGRWFFVGLINGRKKKAIHEKLVKDTEKSIANEYKKNWTPDDLVNHLREDIHLNGRDLLLAQKEIMEMVQNDR